MQCPCLASTSAYNSQSRLLKIRRQKGESSSRKSILPPAFLFIPLGGIEGESAQEMKEIGFPNMAIPLRRRILIPTYPPLDCANEFRKHHRGAQNAPLPKEGKRDTMGEEEEEGRRFCPFRFSLFSPSHSFFSHLGSREGAV